MIHRSKALELEISDFKYHHDLTYTCENIQSQTSNLKHGEIIKV